MEVSGTVFLPLPILFGSGVEFYSDSPASLSVQIFGSRRRRVRVTNSGFSDMGHIQYYSSEPTTWGRIRCGSGKIDMKNIAKDKDKDMIKDEKKMMKKKRLKLVKGLSRDLSMFSDLGFVLDNHGLDDQLKGNIISEATELILGQLQRLKVEEEELKRKRKEENAKQKAAAQMQKKLNCEMSSSSSSSSESSDSECGEVVDMSSLNCVAALAPPVVIELQPVMQETTSPLPSTLTEEANAMDLQSVIPEAHATLTIPSTTNLKVTSTVEEGGITGRCLHHIQQPCFSTQTTTTNCNGGMAGGGTLSVKKVEVCMGGKCKKSGAASLLDEFQRVLGAEASIVGCKCMGKCRDGPNVRILNYSGVQAECLDDSVRVPRNPLCMGVGFEDVGSIVANFLGKKHKDRGLAAAP
ncbi:diacylglycerol O-acyltransferase 3 [Rhododendron vialii]|uniref:diacylglycerol O-acyltransferase 3 n=1 Tax=Rhododendron vialii TaxID=182163 RepID=UPI00265FE71C|nr:diacylglycerol O-acyltransferase 3 [Rhododendron vialii]